jgi:hypothetical protein
VEGVEKVSRSPVLAPLLCLYLPYVGVVVVDILRAGA